MKFLSKLLSCLALLAVMLSPTAHASPPGCVGKMWNPLTDLDFRLMGGIKILGMQMMKAPSQLGEPPKHQVDPICFCKNGLQTGFGFGLTFWMPSYINDMARQAGCLGFLNGVNILPGFAALSSSQEYNHHAAKKDGTTNMQVHWAFADVTAIAGKSLFEKCNAVTGAMTISYLTEPDFIFQNDIYSIIMTPQAAILAESAMLSQMACGFESIANTLGDWQDFGVCAWNGARMPLDGNTIAKNSAQVSNMDITIKYLTRSALLGTTMRTMGKDAICTPQRDVFYDPFQNRFQWSFPGKVSTRYNVDVIRWGLFIKDDGQAGMMQLTDEAGQLGGVDTNIKVGSQNPANQSATPTAATQGLADKVMASIPKPLNYPTKEAGYMQVWEARQCCLMVLTIQNVLQTIVTNMLTMGSETIKMMYDTYNTVNTVYTLVRDPIGGVLNLIGQGIGKVIGKAADGIGESIGNMVGPSTCC